MLKVSEVNPAVVIKEVTGFERKLDKSHPQGWAACLHASRVDTGKHLSVSACDELSVDFVPNENVLINSKLRRLEDKVHFATQPP